MMNGRKDFGLWVRRGNAEREVCLNSQRQGEYFPSKILLMYVRVLDDDNSRISAAFPFLTRAHYWALLCDLTFTLSMFKVSL